MGGGEKLDAGGVEDHGNKVVVEEMPKEAIKGRADVVAIAGVERWLAIVSARQSMKVAWA